MRNAAALLAWLLAAFLVFATWCPQPLRPHIGDAGIERFGAFFLTAAMFVAGYPRRAFPIAIGAVAFAVALELGQFVAPGRDPGVPDVIAKILGGLTGVLASHFTLRLLGGAARPVRAHEP